MSKFTWQERVNHINEYHKSRLKENHKHRVEDTAKELGISVGGISQSLQLATFFKTHPAITDYKTAQAALDFIQSKKRKMRIGEE